MERTPARTSGAVVRRRDLLRIGGVGALGLSLAQWLRATLTAHANPAALRAKADRCIVIFLNGGPSHLDMWDMKPDGPVDIRGPFQPISTSLPGVTLCQYLPRLSQWMHVTTLIRSMHHSVNNSHAAAVYAALTGHDRGEQGGGAKPTDHPSPGSVMARLRPTGGQCLPYVALPFKTKEGAGGPLQPGFLAGFMGAAYDPFWVLEDPNAATFRVRNLALPEEISSDRLRRRTQLLAGLGRSLQGRTEQILQSMDAFQTQAFQLLTSNSATRAFQLDQESDATRQRYGRNIYGQTPSWPVA